MSTIDSMIKIVSNKEIPPCPTVVFRRMKRKLAEEANLYLEASHLADDVRKDRLACGVRRLYNLDKYWTIVTTGYEGEERNHGHRTQDERSTREENCRAIEDILREAGKKITKKWWDKDK